MTPDSVAAPDQGVIEGRQDAGATEGVTPSVDADAGPCPACGHDAAEDDVRALAAITAAKNSIVRRQAHVDAYMDAFIERWEAGKPATWRRSLRGLVNAGLPRNVMLDCAEIALDADHIPDRKTFAYFMGVAWNKVREMDGYALERMLRETK